MVQLLGWNAIVPMSQDDRSPWNSSIPVVVLNRKWFSDWVGELLLVTFLGGNAIRVCDRRVCVLNGNILAANTAVVVPLGSKCSQ